MPVVLALLDGVQWHGRPIVGERPQALLAALVAAGRAVSTDRLVDLVWGDDRPAHPAKALQVLVSRTRATVGADALVTDGDGYRLTLDPDAVDATRLRGLAAAARDALATDPLAALRLADEAAALAETLGEPSGAGPLAELRCRALADLAVARTVRVRALSRAGRHAEALADAPADDVNEDTDEGLLTDLLRSEAAVRGVPAALDRYARHRAALRDRLGTDPGPELQRVHRELLAADRPVREGVRYDASTLVGRDDDLRQVTALLTSRRVVSLVGPGGLGKTRLAHVVARQAPQPAVHVVELVGVTSAEDLVGEVGSALGVRDSVSGRRTLTPAQRADVRARIAQHLDQVPTLLVLDNCEHLVDAVADLVAFLVGTTRELRVLTTSRAPLAIAAEHVYLLPPARHRRRGCPVPRPGAGDPAGRPPRRGRRGGGGRAARRPAAGDRARRGQGAGHDADRDRATARGPVRPAAGRRPHRTRPASDAAGGHRLVVAPARRARAAGAAPVVGVPRRVHPRRRLGGAGRGRARPGRRARGPVAGRGRRHRGRRPVPDAGDGPGSSAGSGSARPATPTRHGPPCAGGRSRTPCDTATGSSPATRWPRWTRCAARRPTSPTSCVRRSSSPTRPPSRRCSPPSAASG
ncbi:BTAD domain-containing putative transcriptional regulator [Nocardioides sp. TF02-7]|uniref:AfsR/SARP family transcriptional regulator n=1 Tax=Nocardioides sp. TF02-7 TaxID=2917724 RepID=UPI001F06BCDF|nr:BTAD domain-containing putative transcriptional regulator [Nocardioides sp. TF02-7]UMG91865.1 AAA family ATPase [Nocardioides sp. TF02-7]